MRVVLFNLAAILAILLGFEFYLGVSNERTHHQIEFDTDGGLFLRDIEMGHRPAPGLQTRTRHLYDGKLIYDVAVHFDDHGLRVSPPDPVPNSPCVLFFGGSFTFGEGVENDETLPWQVAVRDQAVGVRNFGYSGYGPHHMLAALETGLVSRAADCQPTHAIYQSVYHHVLRAAGRWFWDANGPRYRIANGQVERDGNFGDRAGTQPMTRLLGGSLLAQRLRLVPGLDLGVDAVTEADLEVFHAVVERARALLVASYPTLRFHVIHWDVGQSIGSVPLFEGHYSLAETDVHRISDVLPPPQSGSDEAWQEAYLLPHDVHPNAKAHALIAEYTASRILQKEEENGPPTANP